MSNMLLRVKMLHVSPAKKAKKNHYYEFLLKGQITFSECY